MASHRRLMRNVKLTIQYDGTDYAGWQSQKNSRAIQDVIEGALTRFLGEPTKVISSSRTDAGVHAKGQVANFKTESQLSISDIKNGLNSILPPDIVISKIERVPLGFHSQYDAKGKVYRYTLSTHNPISPFQKRYVAYIPYRLDLKTMREEAKALLGRHDFSSFEGANSKRKCSTRCIRSIDVKKKARFVYIDIEADGFLYNMARSIVGTLIDAGRGYLKKGCVADILEKHNRRYAGYTAPAKGLCLIKVRYE